MSECCPTATEQANHTIRGDSSRRKGLEPPTEPPTEPPVDSYGYIVGSYYLTGTINGVDCGVTNVDPDMLFLRDTGDQMILSHVVFKQGDVVKAARYNGANTFTIYPDGVGREIVIDKDGVYDIFFKPYEIGNPNYWFITPAFVEEITTTLLGDVDGDGMITALDATWIQRRLARMDVANFNEIAADADGDGNLTALDATWIQRKLARLNVPYPIGEPI